MNTINIQQSLFDHIKSKFPAHLSFVDEIAEILNVSNDSAYRRIRGEKLITLDETYILCTKFHISLDQLLHVRNDTVLFSGNKVDHLTFGFNEYLHSIAENLRLFTTLKNPHLFYFNKDIPLFHFMQFKELSAFKFFFWKRTLMAYPQLARQQFTGAESDEEILQTAEHIINLYTQVSSTEIWTEESIHVTIRQIEFCRHTNLFINKEVLSSVYHQLNELLNHLEIQAENGCKSIYNQKPTPHDRASYHVYINECLIGDNSIFIQSEGQQIAYINHNGLNFMATQDKSFCDYTYKNLQNMISKSTSVSQVGAKDRSIFFNKLREKVQERIKSIHQE